MRTALKKIVCVVVLSFMMTISAKAQIFLDNEEMFRDQSVWLSALVDTLNQVREEVEESYAPIDGGVLIFGLLGGAYLLNKKRKEE